MRISEIQQPLRVLWLGAQVYKNIAFHRDVSKKQPLRVSWLGAGGYKNPKAIHPKTFLGAFLKAPGLLTACSSHAPGVLLACFWLARGMLLMPLACFWPAPVYFWHTSGLLLASSWRATDMLLACSRHALADEAGALV